MTKSALITGITGQDGSYLSELLLKKGYKVFGLERRHSTKNTWRIDHIKDKIELIEGDLTDETSLRSAIKTSEPDEIYNLAAQSSAVASFKHPVYTAEVNAIGTLKLLEAVRASGDSIKLYQASTSDLYGKIQQKPQNELTPFHPVTPYGVAKLFAYWSIVNYRETYGLFAVNGILFNHESPRRGLEFVSRKITNAVAKIHLGKKKDKLVLGNIDSKKDWGFSGDYVEAMWLLLQHKDPVDLVIASGQQHSVRDICKYAFEAVGIENWEAHVTTSKEFIRPADADNLVGDASKARELLGWKPKTTFKQLIKLMVDVDIEYEKQGISRI